MKKLGRPKSDNKKVPLSTVLDKQAKIDLRIIATKKGLAMGDMIGYLVKEYLNKE